MYLHISLGNTKHNNLVKYETLLKWKLLVKGLLIAVVCWLLTKSVPVKKNA